MPITSLYIVVLERDPFYPADVSETQKASRYDPRPTGTWETDNYLVV